MDNLLVVTVVNILITTVVNVLVVTVVKGYLRDSNNKIKKLTFGLYLRKLFQKLDEFMWKYRDIRQPNYAK